jgi:CHAD domain-containing protein
MPRLEKWLTEVGPDAPVTRAARKALKMRLAAVERLLKQAGQVSCIVEDDAESVHQLRIWTRRATAALRLFAEVLPRRTAKWLKRKLRSIRQTAGEARDCDVLAQRLESGDLPSLAPTAVHLRVRRKRAEKELAKKYKSLIRSKRFSRKSEKLLSKVSDREKAGKSLKQPAFGPWCRAQLRPIAAAFFEQAAGDLAKDTQLHELRLTGKRLRYALELAPAALPATTHRRLYDELSDLQDRLGLVCDQIVALARLKEWHDEARAADVRQQLRAAQSQQRKQLAAARQRFLRWWSPKRRESLRKSWERALRADRG